MDEAAGRAAAHNDEPSARIAATRPPLAVPRSHEREKIVMEPPRGGTGNPSAVTRPCWLWSAGPGRRSMRQGRNRLPSLAATTLRAQRVWGLAGRQRAVARGIIGTAPNSLDMPSPAGASTRTRTVGMRVREPSLGPGAQDLAFGAPSRWPQSLASLLDSSPGGPVAWREGLRHGRGGGMGGSRWPVVIEPPLEGIARRRVRWRTTSSRLDSCSIAARTPPTFPLLRNRRELTSRCGLGGSHGLYLAALVHAACHTNMDGESGHGCRVTAPTANGDVAADGLVARRALSDWAISPTPPPDRPVSRPQLAEAGPGYVAWPGGHDGMSRGLTEVVAWRTMRLPCPRPSLCSKRAGSQPFLSLHRQWASRRGAI
ncbi:hypothetical protein CDD83_4502 [Cordyceps sp. RAO-2017]|nr:hypothetical protein CDD83_4502 [Cordyceps sp. RAO-2017]